MDRNYSPLSENPMISIVALRKESVDRNIIRVRYYTYIYSRSP